jgi:hypothetical protein
MARWNLTTPNQTDRAVRTYLARTGGDNGDLARVVDAAVRRHVFAQTVRAVKARNAGADQDGLLDLIERETDAVRAGRSR